MHLLFLDESGRLDQVGLFALGGIAVRDADWAVLKALWQGTLREHRWPLDREVKWHGIRKGEVPPALADAVFVALSAAPFTAYVAVMDLDRGPEVFPPNEHAYFRSSEDVYGTALMFLAERFHHLLQSEDDVGIIVIDSRFKEEDARLRRFFGDRGRNAVREPPAHRRRPLPGAEPVLDRPPVRRPRRRLDPGRAARGQSGKRLPEEAPPPLRPPYGDRRARGRRAEAVP
jgi:hypothetical protein